MNNYHPNAGHPHPSQPQPQPQPQQATSGTSSAAQAYATSPVPKTNRQISNGGTASGSNGTTAGPSNSPVTATAAPCTLEMYNSAAVAAAAAVAADAVNYVQVSSSQPTTFPAIAVSRAALNYNPVIISRIFQHFFLIFEWGWEKNPI